MSVLKLRLYCRQNGIKIVSGAKKADIIRAVQHFKGLGEPQQAQTGCESIRRPHKGRQIPITPSSRLKLSEQRTQALKLAQLQYQVQGGPTSMETSLPPAVTSGSAMVANTYNWVKFFLKPMS